ncbi:hypothetical protein Ac2012v2_007037 [Leucoagaricus gongylophorus]
MVGIIGEQDQIGCSRCLDGETVLEGLSLSLSVSFPRDFTRRLLPPGGPVFWLETVDRSGSLVPGETLDGLRGRRRRC